MSTTGKRDDDGDPGKTGRWKDGFNLDCGLPGTLLLENESSGPWRVFENARAPKNRYYVARVGAQKVSIEWVMRGLCPVAWVGSTIGLARMLCERFNAYEMARDFPPRPLP